jgi:hypothetical protein
LNGFKPFIRQELRLTVGFVARVDAVMQAGAIEESVTVSGQSPVVDVTTTSASVAFTRETLEAVPRGRDLQNVFAMAPGVTQPIPDVGGTNMANRTNISSYGVAAQPKLQVEGMNVTMGADQSAGVYFRDNTLEEVQIKTSGADAEVSVPGISFVGVLKSGGNDFHGIYTAAAETPMLQADNLDAPRAGPHDDLAAREFLRCVGGSGRTHPARQTLVLRCPEPAEAGARHARVRRRAGTRRLRGGPRCRLTHIERDQPGR